MHFDFKEIIEIIHFSVNMVSDRKAQERYLQFLSRRNDNFTHQSNGDDKKIEQVNSNEWEEWMRNQPISILRLDRTERLVLKIGGWFPFSKNFSKFY